MLKKAICIPAVDVHDSFFVTLPSRTFQLIQAYPKQLPFVQDEVNPRIRRRRLSQLRAGQPSMYLPLPLLQRFPYLTYIVRRFENTTQVTTGTRPAYTPVNGPCQLGSFTCNSRSSFSQCAPASSGGSSYTFMGPTPAGMICQNGQIVRDTLGPCSPAGSLQCLNSGTSFGLCDQSGLIYMGIVAPGTACRNGTIVAA